MKLIDRQIKGVRETLEQFREEYEEGKDCHDQDTCALCKYFINRRWDDCGDCPFRLLVDTKSIPCIEFMDEEGVCTDREHFEEIAGFLKSLEISLEMMR